MRGIGKYMAYGISLLAVMSIILLGGCTGTEPTDSEGGSSGFITMIIFLVLIFAVMYFLMIRPQRKKQSQHSQLIQELQRGDKVITAGGIYGEVDSVTENEVVLKVEDGNKLRFLKNSVVGKQETEEPGS
ncbi:MAG: preprotein translocase subunit YajC [Chloroflexota bacterium]